MTPALDEPGPRGASAAARTPVSVLVPTLDEAADLPGCLESLSFADEVVVVDSGSTDATAGRPGRPSAGHEPGPL